MIALSYRQRLRTFVLREGTTAWLPLAYSPTQYTKGIQGKCYAARRRKGAIYSAWVVYSVYRLGPNRALSLARVFQRNRICFPHKASRGGLRFLLACLRLFVSGEFAVYFAVSVPFLPSCFPPACRKHSEEVPCLRHLNNGWNRRRA